MKKNFLWILFAFAAACSGTAKQKDAPSMTGAYQMLSQSVKGDNADTTFINLQQLKIYTPDYMMYVKINPADSVAAFGIGSYTADTGSITENIIYSAANTSVTTAVKPFSLEIQKTDKGYKQMINDVQQQGKKYTITEDYEEVGTNDSTAIDGAWEQTRFMNVKGMDTNFSGPKQFKVYYKGHFVWGNTYTDAAGNKSTHIGFGTFTMQGSNMIKETVAASSYSDLKGRTVDIDVVMDGNDGYTQTILNPDSSKTTEVYKRLKK